MDGTLLNKKLKIEEKLAQLNEIAQKVDGMPTFTSNDRAFLEELPGFPVTDGKKVLTATTESGETTLEYEEVEGGGGVYATTETEVGEYKGEKLYRRLFRFTANESGNRDLDTSAIYKIAFLEWGFCEFPNGSENWKFPLPFYTPGGYNVYLTVVPFVQDHKLRLNVAVANAGEVINRAVELCILYTKYGVSKKTKKKSEE